MAKGDLADFQARIKAVIPAGWFPDTSPVLDSLLAGLATMWSQLYAMWSYVTAQCRIATATDVNLDLVALDMFGPRLLRAPAEADSSFRARISAALFPTRGTRAAMVATVTALTGRVPSIVEPANTSDTGGYSTGYARTWGGAAYGVAGAYGSLGMPCQAFVVAYRPHGTGIAGVAGYYTGSGWAGGGYGSGAIEYVSPAMITGTVTDAMIYQTIADSAPAGTLMWVALSN